MPTSDAARQRILAVVRRIPCGRVATYGQVAALAGLPRRARLVGRVLAAHGDEVPWQRVINAHGEVSERAAGRSLPGLAEGFQRHLLAEEGVVIDRAGRVDLERFRWEPEPDPRRRRRLRKPAGTAAEVRAIAAALQPQGSARRAAGAKAYLKSDLEFYGLDTAALRGTVLRWQREHRELGRPARLRLVRALWREPVHELRAFAVELLLALAPELQPDDLALLEWILRRSRTWAYVDALAIHVVGPLVERQPRLACTLDRWARDDDFWIRRSAILALVLPLRRGAGDWERLERYVDRMLGERQFFIRKALGWALREAAKQEPGRVERLVAARLGAMSGVTFREAVRPLPARRRDRLAAAFRRARG